MITFTITSCKRLDLFKQSINSFINSCEDLNLISQWICIDDNSSKEDREEMKTLYPFFNFILKSEENKGHSKSMNLLLENVKNKFFFQMEDDWIFFQKAPYLSRCLEILKEQEKYGQVVINRNYAELADNNNIKIAGGFRKRTSKNNIRYVLHEHYARGSKEEGDFFQRNRDSTSSCYWPNFSLNPSLIKMEIFKDVGAFENVPHFEMSFAHRYTSLGYQTCFLDGVYVSHIGRKNSERGNFETKNAYELNGLKQF